MSSPTSKPGEMRHQLPGDLHGSPRLLVEADALVAVALPEALDGDHQIGPHRLGAGVAAPGAAHDRRHQEQGQCAEHEQAGDVVEFLRPDLEEEEEIAVVGHVQQHGLIGEIGAAAPPDPRQCVVDAERDRHHQPLDAAERSVRELRIDLLAARVEFALGLGVDRVDVVCRARRTRARLPGLLRLSRTVVTAPGSSPLSSRRRRSHAHSSRLARRAVASRRRLGLERDQALAPPRAAGPLAWHASA